MASLADIVASIKDTNDLLTDNVKAQQRVFDIMDDAARKDKEARMDALQSTKKTKAVRGGGGFGASFKDGLGMGTAFGAASSLIGGLLGKLTIPLLAAAAYAFDQIAFGGEGLKGIKEWGKNLIAGVIDKLDFMDLLDDKQNSDIAKSIMKAAGPALVVALFSKKAGLITFIGSLFGNFIFDKVFPEGSETRTKMETEYNKGFQSMFGLDVLNSTLFKIGAAIGGFFGLQLIGSAISLAFTGGMYNLGYLLSGGPKSKKSVPMSDTNQKKFRGAFGSRLGIGMIMFAVGGQIADYISNALNGAVESSKVESIINDSILLSLVNKRAAIYLAIVRTALAAFDAVLAIITGKEVTKKETLKSLSAVAESKLRLSEANKGDVGAAQAELAAAKEAEFKQFMKLANQYGSNRDMQTQLNKVYTLEDKRRILGTGFNQADGTDFLSESAGKRFLGLEPTTNPFKIKAYKDDSELNPYGPNDPMREKFRLEANKRSRDLGLITSSSVIPNDNVNGTNGQNVSAQVNQSNMQANAYTFLGDNRNLVTAETVSYLLNA